MKKKDETEKTPGVKLKVKKSPIRIGGSIRVHDSILKELGCEEKDQVVLMNDDDKQILNTIYADELVAKDTVILRTESMKDLDVKEGDEITLQVNKKILENLKEKSGDFKDDVKEKSGKFKDDVKEKSGDLKDDVKEKSGGFKDSVKKKFSKDEDKEEYKEG